MAHYAKIGLNSKVISVNPVDNNIIINADGREDDDLAVSHLISTTGWPFWIKCSYNTRNGKHWNEDNTESSTQEKALRRFYPAIGDYYDEEVDAFYKAKPTGCDSWTLNTTTGQWEAPVATPDKGHRVVGGVNIPYIVNWSEANSRWQASDEYGGTEDKYWNPDTKTWIDM